MSNGCSDVTDRWQSSVHAVHSVRDPTYPLPIDEETSPIFFSSSSLILFFIPSHSKTAPSFMDDGILALMGNGIQKNSLIYQFGNGRFIKRRDREVPSSLPTPPHFQRHLKWRAFFSQFEKLSLFSFLFYYDIHYYFMYEIKYFKRKYTLPFAYFIPDHYLFALSIYKNLAS